MLISGSIVIILKELNKRKDNVQQSEDFTNTKTSMEIDAKKDSELISIIELYAPWNEAGIRRLILQRRDLSADKKKSMLDNLNIVARFPSVEDKQSAIKFIVGRT